MTRYLSSAIHHIRAQIRSGSVFLLFSSKLQLLLNFISVRFSTRVSDIHRVKILNLLMSTNHVMTVLVPISACFGALLVIALLYALIDRETLREKIRKAKFLQLTGVDGPTMAKFFQEMAKEMPIRFTAQQLMLEGGVDIVAPPKPFQYLFPNDVNASKNLQCTEGSSDSTSEGSNSFWYKETTPTMKKYDIQVASS
ncbi:hypothetical protein L6164_037473 [Bauhinia variegata]|uniref:Uncharacterized protein n=1 Tax=Bauhinia variegata TaxID=167791 RepID=A0ACB9KK32_BAUVA|nr:hypothetical protein L6164_037473 [Bauhinia variegata]